MSRSRIQILVGLALGLILAGLAASAVLNDQGHEQQARQLALKEAQSQLDAELDAALDALEVALRGAPLAGLNHVNLAPLSSSHLMIVRPDSGKLTINAQLGSQGHLCLVATTEGERRVLASDVAPLFRGESVDYMDDNGNDVMDESGLYFTVFQSTIEFGLTLSRPSPHGLLIASGARRVKLQGHRAPRSPSNRDD